VVGWRACHVTKPPSLEIRGEAQTGGAPRPDAFCSCHRHDAPKAPKSLFSGVSRGTLDVGLCDIASAFSAQESAMSQEPGARACPH
jgi:hypothetical protein